MCIIKSMPPYYSALGEDDKKMLVARAFSFHARKAASMVS